MNNISCFQTVFLHLFLFPSGYFTTMGKSTILTFAILINFFVTSKARIFQEQYHVIENCNNHAPPTNSIFSSVTMRNILKCVKQCQINMACQSFAYKSQTAQCLLSRKNITDCNELEPNIGSKSYKVFGYKVWKEHFLSLRSGLLSWTTET